MIVSDAVYIEKSALLYYSNGIMKNKAEIWTAMILSAYARKLGIPISEATERLLSRGGLDYLEDCYEALHTQSNDDVVEELIDMAKVEAVR